MAPAVYVQTNDAAGNEIVAFSRAEDGTLAALGRYSTGGRGTGQPHLPSQSSVVLSNDGRWLLVVNAGSDELSLLAVEPDGLRLLGAAQLIKRGEPAGHRLEKLSDHLHGYIVGWEDAADACAK